MKLPITMGTYGREPSLLPPSLVAKILEKHASSSPRLPRVKQESRAVAGKQRDAAVNLD